MPVPTVYACNNVCWTSDKFPSQCDNEVNFEPWNVTLEANILDKLSYEIRSEIRSGFQGSLGWDGNSLGLCLFCDILNGQALLANDGSHKLCRHKHAQGEVGLSRPRSTKFPWGSGLRGALITGRPTSAPCAGGLVGRCSVHVHNIWHLERVVVELVSC